MCASAQTRLLPRTFTQDSFSSTRDPLPVQPVLSLHRCAQRQLCRQSPASTACPGSTSAVPPVPCQYSLSWPFIAVLNVSCAVSPLPVQPVLALHRCAQRQLCRQSPVSTACPGPSSLCLTSAVPPVPCQYSLSWPFIAVLNVSCAASPLSVQPVLALHRCT